MFKKRNSKEIHKTQYFFFGVLHFATFERNKESMLRVSRAVLQAQKAVMIKSYKIVDLTAQCSAHDAIFARKMPKGGCQFFAWPGVSHAQASSAILAMPAHLQTVHAMFGRNGTPMDLCADIDCPVPQSLGSVQEITDFQNKTVQETARTLREIIKSEGHEVETQVCLQSPNLKKASFHLHIRLKDTAFEDYRSVLGFLQPHKDKIPHVDLQIFRTNGMLRMHKSKKENLQSQMTLFAPATVSAIPMTDPLAAQYSLCIREANSFRNVITKVPQVTFSSTFVQGAAAGCGVLPQQGLNEPTLIPRTKTEALENAKQWALAATEEDVGSWKKWIGVGYALHRVARQYHNTSVASFEGRTPEQELLRVWVEISKRCPSKFVPGDCEKSWATFKDDASPDGWWTSYKSLHRIFKQRQQQ